MRTPKGKEVFIFDNEGETADRFTIIVKHDGTVFGASCHPFHPLGFGQFCGDVYGYGFHDSRGMKAATRYARKARRNPDWLGKEVTEFDKLPEDVKTYVEQITE